MAVLSLHVTRRCCYRDFSSSVTTFDSNASTRRRRRRRRSFICISTREQTAKNTKVGQQKPGLDRKPLFFFHVASQNKVNAEVCQESVAKQKQSNKLNFVILPAGNVLPLTAERSIMTEVYSPTTAPNPKSSCFSVSSDNLDRVRFALKVLQVLLSLVAFVLEEVVSSCLSCSALYFFEFVSCTAFLFTLLLVILLSTPLHGRVGISCWPKLDFVYTAVMALLFLIASIVFAADNGGSTEEATAVAFGFLATMMFFSDVGYFLKTRGLPFMSGGAPDTSNVGVAAPAEVEKLNAPE